MEPEADPISREKMPLRLKRRRMLTVRIVTSLSPSDHLAGARGSTQGRIIIIRVTSRRAALGQHQEQGHLDRR
jgi:hypothetical protein